MRRRVQSIGLGMAISCGRVLTGDAQAAVALPGQTISVTLSPAVTPIALNYDFMASKLYAVVIQDPGNAHVFGSINPATGVFTPIPAGGALNTGGLLAGGILTIKAGNPLLKRSAAALFLRTDGLIGVDLQTANLTILPTPQPAYPTAITADPLTNIVFGRASSGVLALDGATGVETVVAPYNLGGGVLSIASAVDPYHATFFVEEEAGATAMLDQINERNGQVTRKVALAVPVFALGFDVSTGPKSAALYGITECCATSLPADNQLVRIDPMSGAETPIAVVGSRSLGFPLGLSSTVDGNDALYTTSLSSQIVTADTTVDRSWYVESPIGERLSSLNAWMVQAGQAMGQRDATLTTSRTVNAILDFGQPGQNKAGIYGVLGFKGAQFLPVTIIAAAVIHFVDGWAAGIGSQSNPSLRVVVGTNNYGSGLTQQHGQAWRATVRAISKVLSGRPYASRVTVRGGIDIEMLYGPPASVASWANGYGSNSYADFGDAQGCPSNCAGGWTAAQVVSLGGDAFFPEIYSAGGGNAKSWAGLSAIAKMTPGLGSPLPIVAPLSQSTACQQRGTCGITTATRTDNTPMASWVQLTQALIQQVGVSGALLEPATSIEHRVPK